MRRNHTTRLLHRSAAALLASALSVGCVEPDPEPTNNTSNNTTAQNNTSNNTTTENNTTAPGVTCESACAEMGGVAMCVPAAGACPAAPADFTTTCEARCAALQDPVLQGYSSLGCEAAPSFVAGLFGASLGCSVDSCASDMSYYMSGNTGMDGWDACISDASSTVYARFNETISSGGRVGGYEQIADKLWRVDGAPSSDDFLDARQIYATDEGLDSRVQRREDEHFPPVSDGMGGTLRCRDEGVPAMDPNRCVGPAKILPVLNDAFMKGATGADPLVHAARVDAALTWFLYVSTHKEVITCTNVKKDCDSSYAYYSGDRPRGEGIGLAKLYRDMVPEAHDAVWEGILALRCWRDLDDGDEAMDLALRDQAAAQLDRGLLFGLARVVGARMA
ncbi:MAG: hypothetical protein AAGI01_04965, partial [Myxococcota bacterium]